LNWIIGDFVSKGVKKFRVFLKKKFISWTSDFSDVIYAIIDVYYYITTELFHYHFHTVSDRK
jgi:hypothetical protein